MFYRDEHDEIERASVSSSVTGFNGKRAHTFTETHSLDIVLTLECGRGMQDSISLGDQIFAIIKRPVCFCCPACFFHDIITQAFLITMVHKAFWSLIWEENHNINLSLPSITSNISLPAYSDDVMIYQTGPWRRIQTYVMNADRKDGSMGAVNRC